MPFAKLHCRSATRQRIVQDFRRSAGRGLLQLRRVKEGNDRFELFNLSDDPREEHDLAAQHTEIIDRMWQFVSASHTEPANPKFRMEVGRK